MIQIPVHTIQTMFGGRKTHLLLTYLKLKAISNSFGQVNLLGIGELSIKLGLSPKTIKKHIEELKNRNWLTIDRFNSNLLIVRSMWKINLENKRCPVTKKGIAYYKHVVRIDGLSIMDFSHKDIGTFNALLSECLIEQMIKMKSRGAKEIANIEQAANLMTVDGLLENSNCHEINELLSQKTKLINSLKSSKIALSKLRFMNTGNFGKSHVDVTDRIKHYNILTATNRKNLTDLEIKLKEYISKQPNTIKPNLSESKITEKVDEFSAAFDTIRNVDREDSNSELGVQINIEIKEKSNTIESFKNSTDGLYDTSHYWSSKVVGRCLTTISKYRNRLAKAELVSQTPVNLNKTHLQHNDTKLVNYYSPFKLLIHSKKLDGLSMEATDMLYSQVKEDNTESYGSFKFFTKCGVKEIYSSQRTSHIRIYSKKSFKN